MEIDFVVLWVDGNDKEWLNQKRAYLPGCAGNADLGVNRYRDWDNMQYWFRAVEKYAPWVRKIHFVTYGHVPNWLNLNHPKLNVVNHVDFIPEQYLPTFSSNPIELNLHRIDDLSEKFVYFNDDMFIVSEVQEEDFFLGNLPCDIAAMDAVCPDDLFSKIVFNNIGLINQHFLKRTILKSNLTKWFNPKYGRFLIKTILLLPWAKFTGFENPHISIAFLKNTFFDVWNSQKDSLDQTCRNRFRTDRDFSVWLMRYWQLVSGTFCPTKRIGKYYSIHSSEDCAMIKSSIAMQKNKVICLNDIIESENEFDKCKEIVKNIFDELLPSKSAYEL